MFSFEYVAGAMQGACEVCSGVECGAEGYVKFLVGETWVLSIGKTCAHGIAGALPKVQKTKRKVKA